MRNKITRWTVGTGVAILLLVVLAIGLAVRWREDDRTLERVQATGELRVGLDASFPPFETLDAAGNIVGFDADLAHAIAAALGVKPVFVNVGFDGLYDALQADRVDVVISGLPYDPRRTQDVIYSQPYFNAGQALVVRVNDTAITTRESLAGRKVAVEWGSLADMEARHLKQDIGNLETLPQPTAQDTLNVLVDGQVDAAIADAVSVYQFIGAGGGQVRVVEMLTDEPYVIAARVKSRGLAKAINEVLTTMRETGELEALRSKWF